MSNFNNRQASEARSTSSSVDVVRGLYESLQAGDISGVVARLDSDLLVDEPLALPYGGVHHGREVFVQSILGTMSGHAQVEITDIAVFEGDHGVVGAVTGTLTAHSTRERFALTMVELHEVVGDTIRKIDVYTKNPELLAAFYARAAAADASSRA